jgi:hypothetical protein
LDLGIADTLVALTSGVAVKRLSYVTSSETLAYQEQRKKSAQPNSSLLGAA